MRERWRTGLRAGWYLVITLLSGMVSLVMLPLTLVVLLTVPIGGLGLWLLPRWLKVLHEWSRVQRRRSARWLGKTVQEVPGPGTDDFRRLWKERAGRRIVLWLPAFSALGLLLGLVGVFPLSLLVNTVQNLMWWLLPAGKYPQPYGVVIDGWPLALGSSALQLLLAVLLVPTILAPVARVHARTCLRLLEPSEAETLAVQVDELQRTRADVVDTHGAELRRIERDLHDGTQARLVAIAMQLGLAQEGEADPHIAELIERAHRGTEEAMVELRDVIRGIHPPILADRGLPGALTALAGRTTLPVRLDVTDPGELPVAVETAVYYAVTEAVTNAVRHSGATSISICLTREDGTLRAEVFDDGHGGADEDAGSGIQGVRRRVAALDGDVSVVSPAGGPTVIGMVLPCGS